MNLSDFKNQEKYNLFVAASEEAWETDSYIMPLDRCLTSFTSSELKSEYNLLDESIRDKIKEYPCIFAYEDYNKCDSYVGYITEIIVRSSGIKIYYQKLGVILFDDLHKLTFELDIDMSRGITELMHTHWTIKNVNLYRELNKLSGLDFKLTKPSVFISYCWTPKENKDRVINLAERLYKDGVNVLYDKKSLLPGQDINAFMESLATNKDIKKVLIICNSDYVKKADSRQGGVGTESEIIIPQVYGNPMQNKIIPIYFERDSDGKNYCPIYLRSRLAIDFTGNYEEGYQELLEDIFR